MNISVINILMVAAGSGIGGVCRYLLSKVVQESSNATIPVGTLVVNILGCFCIGLLFGFIQKAGGMNEYLKLFLTVGFCGGFTTFSTFINENWMMLSDNRLLPTLAYLLLSLLGGFLFLYLGYKLIYTLLY